MVCIFQVALLKQERSNLMVENEELYGKVREAQTLSRKDSVKAKQLETEVDHLKDEFDRLRALYVSTREHMDSMEVSCDIALYPVISNYLPAVKTFYIAPTVFSQTMESGWWWCQFCNLLFIIFPDVFVEADSTRGLERRCGNAAIERRDRGHQDGALRSQIFLREVSHNGSQSRGFQETLGKLSCEGSGKVSIALARHVTCVVLM